MSYIILILKVLLMLVLIIFTFSFYKYINESKVIKNTTISFLKITENRFKKRRTEEEQKILEEGNREEKGFIFKLDLMINRSGIRKKLPFLNTESYIIIMVILVIAAYLVTSILFNGILGFLVGALTLIGLYALLYLLSGIAYEKVEKTILPFVNIMENYSSTDDDIVSIFYKTYPYIDQPLRDYLEDFCDEVRTTGDITGAFRSLEIKIENQKLKEIIRNLEICSRHEANYSEIIQDTRDSLLTYMKQRERRKTIIKNGRQEIILSLAVIVVLIGMLMSFIPNLFIMLLSTSIGNGILLYCIIIIAYSMYTMIDFDKR